MTSHHHQRDRSQGMATRSIHGFSHADNHGAPHPPIYNTTTFGFPDTASLLDVVDGRRAGALYTRYGMNPTITALEETMASIEGAPMAWAFCSGMAAEAALFLAHGRDGVVCIGDAYGGTLELVSDQLPLLGIPTASLLGSELDQLERLCARGAGVVFLETPSNPVLEVFDVPAIVEIAHAHGSLVAIDNTFASPVNQRPLELGADVVVYSATKSLGGHSDLTAGFLLGSAHVMGPIWSWRKNLGSTPSPEVAALLARSLRTLTVRIRQQNASAQTVAQAMSVHPRIRTVRYPGLPDDPGHVLATKQMTGFGGIVAIEVDGDGAATSAVADRLELFTLGPSLGGAESLATQPSTTTHHGLSAEERARRGISDSMIRLSIGLEDAEDLIADLHQALR